jgi:hypothetical protein
MPCNCRKAVTTNNAFNAVQLQEGGDRFNLGLLVKEASRGLCVPGYVHPTPDGNGWMYSNAMVGDGGVLACGCVC